MSRLQPVTAAERLTLVDSVRGFALAGVLLANLPIFSGDVYKTDAQRAALPSASLDAVVRVLVQVFVENKFLGLFALLFGLGFSIQMMRARGTGNSVVRTYLRRLGWLFAIGLVHGWLLWCWDILRFYALWGLLLPLFDRCRQRTLLLWGVSLSVLVPSAWYAIVALPASPEGTASLAQAGATLDARAIAAFAGGGYREVLSANWAYDWSLTLSPTQGAYQIAILGRLLLGVWLGRSRLFHEPRVHRAILRRLCVWGLALGLPGNLLFAAMPRLREAGGWDAWLPWTALPVQIGFLGLTVFYACGLALAVERPGWRRCLAALAPVGRMALTNYLMQTMVGLWLFYGFMRGPALFGDLGMAALVPVWLTLFAAQTFWSRAWLSRFRFGPCEWLWRSCTYGLINTTSPLIVPRATAKRRPSWLRARLKI